MNGRLHWLSCLFLLVVGAGGRSFDARLAPARPGKGGAGFAA
jgi:hypothetical protein